MSPLAELEAELPPGTLVTDPDVVAGYRADRADLVPAGHPLAVARVTDTEQVCTAMRWAQRHGVTVIPRGAGTGLSGGANAVDGCLVVSLERMTAIREIDAENHLAVVEAGVINADLGRAVAEHGLFYPPDPGSFEISTIGGNLATNAGGMRCVKYGVTRDATLGLEVVLADGRVLRTGGRAVKNVAGLDLTRLFVGSEGTLGIITAATLRLRPAPPAPPATFVATFPSAPAAGAAVSAIIAAGAVPSMLELMEHEAINAIEDYRRMDLDRNAAALLIGQADGYDAARQVATMIRCCEEAGADFVVDTQDPAEADGLLQARRLAGLALTEQGPSVIEDVGVPRSRLAEMLAALADIAESTGVRIATVGHAGDGNLHPTLILPDLEPATREHALKTAEAVCRAALALGGTVTGEHGVGILKRDWLAGQLDDTALDVHRAIKAALDPRQLLNPNRGW
ncbi:FAD-binding oxidoreductase [Gandjariella thermophila]|uniref:FAD-linked oxidase n=1 Tax=Gandjariella thermophila TaxID=1931992 RepID=A0A4D4J508_9PSEU|nr:FAD-linked oxidase C-terminal domain-containing protein [Gandjariella thermophila]GDY29818.1 FAD-linked oxidase [Gandjariella thermophila]